MLEKVNKSTNALNPSVSLYSTPGTDTTDVYPRLDEIHRTPFHLANSMIQKNNYNPDSMNIIWNKPKKQ